MCVEILENIKKCEGLLFVRSPIGKGGPCMSPAPEKGLNTYFCIFALSVGVSFVNFHKMPAILYVGVGVFAWLSD